MIRVVSALMFFLVLMLSFVFLMQNYQAFDMAITINYRFLFLRLDQPLEVPVYVLMVLSWISGVLLTFFIELAAWIRLRSKMSSQSKTIKKMERELQDLRTLPFADSGVSEKSSPKE